VYIEFGGRAVIESNFRRRRAQLWGGVVTAPRQVAVLSAFVTAWYHAHMLQRNGTRAHRAWLSCVPAGRWD